MPCPPRMSRAPSAYGRPQPCSKTAYGSCLIPKALSQVIAAYGNSLIPESSWVVASDGSLSNSRVPHGVAAYGRFRHVGLRHILTARGSKGGGLPHQGSNLTPRHLL